MIQSRENRISGVVHKIQKLKQNIIPSGEFAQQKEYFCLKGIWLATWFGYKRFGETMTLFIRCRNYGYHIRSKEVGHKIATKEIAPMCISL